MIATILERKRQRVEQARAAIKTIMADLEHYASAHGGRFIVFGSVAKNTMRYDSDFDVIIDFPAPQEGAAWDFVEERCARDGIVADIHPISTLSPQFLARARTDAIALP